MIHRTLGHTPQICPTLCGNQTTYLPERNLLIFIFTPDSGAQSSSQAGRTHFMFQKETLSLHCLPSKCTPSPTCPNGSGPATLLAFLNGQTRAQAPAQECESKRLSRFIMESKISDISESCEIGDPETYPHGQERED